MQVDGGLGLQTLAALQTFLHKQPTGCESVVDGGFNVDTIRSLQRHLFAVGYYDGPIDASFGAQSVLAMQRWMSEQYGCDDGGMDGGWGRGTTLALQKMLNANYAGVEPRSPAAPRPVPAALVQAAPPAGFPFFSFNFESLRPPRTPEEFLRRASQAAGGESIVQLCIQDHSDQEQPHLHVMVCQIKSPHAYAPMPTHIQAWAWVPMKTPTCMWMRHQVISHKS